MQTMTKWKRGKPEIRQDKQRSLRVKLRKNQRHSAAGSLMKSRDILGL